MADDRPRAQLTLAAALLIAVLLIATAMVLNSVLVTQNRATQPGPAEADPEAFRSALADRTANALARLNAGNDANDSHATLRADLDTRLAEWTASASSEYAAAGSAVDVDVAGVVNGTRLRQTDHGRALTPVGATGQSNWTLVRDVEGVHRFELNLSVDSLYGASGSTNVSTLRARALQVTVANDSRTWRVLLYETGADLGVLVEDSTAPYGPDEELSSLGSDVCSEPGENVTVRLADGLVEDRSCAGLAFLDAVAGPYDVHYNRSAGNRGTYDLFVDRGSVDGTPYAAMLSGGDPFRQAALYAATVHVRFTDGDLEYSASPTVDPVPAPH